MPRDIDAVLSFALHTLPAMDTVSRVIRLGLDNYSPTLTPVILGLVSPRSFDFCSTHTALTPHSPQEHACNLP